MTDLPAHKRHQRSRGPWMLKAVGAWGTGRRSLFDFDVFILDLGQNPDDDPTIPEGPAETSFIREDVEPTPGLDVSLRGTEQVLEYLGEGSWAVRDA